MYAIRSYYAVNRVGVERHIGNHAQLGETRLEPGHDGGHETIGIPRFLGQLTLAIGLDDREQGQLV